MWVEEAGLSSLTKLLKGKSQLRHLKDAERWLDQPCRWFLGRTTNGNLVGPIGKPHQAAMLGDEHLSMNSMVST